jgi:ABC-type branched-subunit amino acid transport system substrate-binding protein
MNKTKFVGFLLIVALLAVSFATVQAQDECEFAEDSIRIGALAPLSAPGSVTGGIAMQWALNTAEQDINAAPNCGVTIDGVNHEVEVIVADSEGLPERGQAVTERLIFENEVVAMVGAYHSAVGLATMGILQENQIPTVYAETWNDNITANGIQPYNEAPARIDANGVDYIFRVAPTSTMVSRATVDWFDSLGVESVVIIAENTDYGIGASESDQTFMEELGMAVEVIFVELGTEDFVPILSRIQAGELPDAVRVQVTGETAYNLTQQMSELGIAPTEDTICVTNQVAIDHIAYWQNVPDGNYCAFTKVGLSPANYNDITNDVVQRYADALNSEAPSYALEAYDSLWIMADSIERAGTLDADAVVAAIEATDMELAQGRYYFEYTSENPVPDGVPAWMWHQWPDPAVLVLQYYEEGQAGDEAAVVWPEAYLTNDTTYIVPGS